MQTKKKGICGICPYNCHVVVVLENNIIIDVLPDKDSPHGNLCPRGKVAPHIVYSDRRIKKPLIRTERKGTVSFREATWEEAIDIVGENFNKIISIYGSKALASYMGGGSLEDSLNDFYIDYFGHIGSPNDMSSGSICYVASRILAPVTTTGLYSRAFTSDIDNSDVVLAWGTNPKTDSGIGQFRKVLNAKKRGAKIITIDPLKNETAEVSDIWVSIKPGTDGALILAMLKLIINSERYDKKFAHEYTYGFEDLIVYLNSLTLEYLSKCCGIEIELIKEITDIFCSTEKASVIFYTGLEYQPSAVQNTRAIYCLWALGGKLDVKGGLHIDRYPAEQATEYEFNIDNIPVGAKEYPVFSALCGRGQFVEFPKAVLEDNPYPVKGLLTLGGSPILSYPNKDIWKSVYKKLDFLVVIDRFMNEECKWADVVLPATTYYENTSYCYYPDSIRLREKIIEPVGEAKNDIFILQSIADKLGFGHLFPKTDREILEMAFKDDKDTLKGIKENLYGVKRKEPEVKYKKYETGHLRKDGEKGFPTPTGKFEIKSTILEKYGYEGLPVYIDPYELGYKEEKYKFLLTTGARSLFRYNSFGSNIEELAIKEKEVNVAISQRDAEHFNIEDGEKVKVETPFGSMVFPAKISNIMEGVLHIPYGGGSSFQVEGWSKYNPNEICGYNFRDDISGFITCKAVPCNISKTKE
ncbi:molybdopterin-dependent oxidoreductase [Tissierella sp.]|uniref:molybdopterin-containing oxidoreductase family protein n=1 Tax=Tissierella sp. TaxID=41274 RepID=UPI0028B004BB|nr:molybdopterin-dependent oxidoreductase [Tissierella sp.]